MPKAAYPRKLLAVCSEIAKAGSLAPITTRLRRRQAAIEDSKGKRPAGFVTVAGYASEHPGSWRSVLPADSVPPAPPRRYGKRDVDLTAPLDPIPELGVMTLSGGSVLGPHGWVFTADGRFLAEHSWHGLHATIDMLPQRLPPPLRLSGVCVNLASEFSRKNYCHFVLDCLGRIGLLRKAGIGLDDLDYIYCPRPFSAPTLGIMKDLGVPLHKCVWSQDTRCVTADTVLSPSFPGTRRNYPSWLVDFLRSASPPAVLKARRIYIPRGGDRRIHNEAAIQDILEEFGFETYDFNRPHRPADYFASATHVVGAHGAGLTNLVFCRPGTKVLEIIPSDHVYPHYFTLSRAGALDYGYLLGESHGSRPAGTFGRSPFDFTVDIDEFRDALLDLAAGADNLRP